MRANTRCCCSGESGVVARYLECTPVISIPASSYMLGDVKFFLDLGADFELSPDLELYAGGSASTAGIPILLKYLDVFVPDNISRIHWSDNVATNAGNLGDIYALRHRGWRVKDSGLKLTGLQMDTGDGVEGTRIILSKPSSGSSGIFQVDDGGFYFLGGTFNDTPALVEERTGVDNTGEPVNYFLGYNPRRECSRPEQGRYYGNDDKPRLLFDFTSEFPATITLSFTRRYKKGGSSSNPTRTLEFTKTYSKFVGGSATRQSVETIPDPDSSFLTYTNVDGYIEDDPEDSDLILFGYRAIDCTIVETDPDNPSKTIKYSFPSMPVKYYSFGKSDGFFSFGSGVKVASGDGGEGLEDVKTNEDFSLTTLLPQMLNFGVLMSDVSFGFGKDSLSTGVPTPPVDSHIAVESQFLGTTQTGFNAGPPFPVAGGGFSNTTNSTVSFKGITELNSIHTFSLEAAYFGRFMPRVKRGILGGDLPTAESYTIRNVISYVMGTIDFPAFALDSKSGLVGLRNMSNPFGGAYHYLTDGLSSGSYFDFISAVDNVTQS